MYDEIVLYFSCQNHQFSLDIIDIFTNIISLSSFSLVTIYILGKALSIAFSDFYPTTYIFFNTFLLVVFMIFKSCIYNTKTSDKTWPKTNIRPSKILHVRMFSVHLYVFYYFSAASAGGASFIFSRKARHPLQPCRCFRISSPVSPLVVPSA